MPVDTVARLKLILRQSELSALLKVCESTLRTPEAEARFVLRQELERQGLLKIEGEKPNEQQQG